jgi:hypothetical protein
MFDQIELMLGQGPTTKMPKRWARCFGCCASGFSMKLQRTWHTLAVVDKGDCSLAEGESVAIKVLRAWHADMLAVSPLQTDFFN